MRVFWMDSWRTACRLKEIERESGKFPETKASRWYEQAGTGPSRRHIQGSKIAKRLPSVKYSFTVVENRQFFEIFF